MKLPKILEENNLKYASHRSKNCAANELNLTNPASSSRNIGGKTMQKMGSNVQSPSQKPVQPSNQNNTSTRFKSTTRPGRKQSYIQKAIIGTSMDSLKMKQLLGQDNLDRTVNTISPQTHMPHGYNNITAAQQKAISKFIGQNIPVDQDIKGESLFRMKDTAGAGHFQESSHIFRTLGPKSGIGENEQVAVSPRVRLENMDWYKNPQEIDVNYGIQSSNPNNMMFKSPRTILVNKFDKDEMLKMRKNPRFLSQSLEFKTPQAEHSKTLAMSPSMQKQLLKELHKINSPQKNILQGKTQSLNYSIEKSQSKAKKEQSFAKNDHVFTIDKQQDQKSNQYSVSPRTGSDQDSTYDPRNQIINPHNPFNWSPRRNIDYSATNRLSNKNTEERSASLEKDASGSFRTLPNIIFNHKDLPKAITIENSPNRSNGKQSISPRKFATGSPTLVPGQIGSGQKISIIERIPEHSENYKMRQVHQNLEIQPSSIGSTLKNTSFKYQIEDYANQGPMNQATESPKQVHSTGKGAKNEKIRYSHLHSLNKKQNEFSIAIPNGNVGGDSEPEQWDDDQLPDSIFGFEKMRYKRTSEIQKYNLNQAISSARQRTIQHLSTIAEDNKKLSSMLNLTQAQYYSKIFSDEKQKSNLKIELEGQLKSKLKQEKRIRKRQEKYAMEVKLQDQLQKEIDQHSHARKKLIEVQNQLQIHKQRNKNRTDRYKERASEIIRDNRSQLFIKESEIERFSKGKMGPVFYQQSKPVKMQNDDPQYLGQFVNCLPEIKKKSLIQQNYEQFQQQHLKIDQLQNLQKQRSIERLNQIKKNWIEATQTQKLK